MTRTAASLPCPGCGQKVMLRVPTEGSEDTTYTLICLHCGEDLGLSPDRKLYLLHPISTYWDLERPSTIPDPALRSSTSPGTHSVLASDAEMIPGGASMANRPPSSAEYRRKQASLERAIERNASEQAEAAHNRVVGIALLVVGNALGIISIVRLFFTDLSWIDLLAPGLIWLGLNATGLYLILSGSLLIRTARHELNELNQELQVIQGLVADDS